VKPPLQCSASVVIIIMLYTMCAFINNHLLIFKIYTYMLCVIYDYYPYIIVIIFFRYLHFVNIDKLNEHLIYYYVCSNVFTVKSSPPVWR